MTSVVVVMMMVTRQNGLPFSMTAISGRYGKGVVLGESYARCRGMPKRKKNESKRNSAYPFSEIPNPVSNIVAGVVK